MAKIKKIKITKTISYERCAGIGTLIHCWWKCKMVQPVCFLSVLMNWYHKILLFYIVILIKFYLCTYLQLPLLLSPSHFFLHFCQGLFSFCLTTLCSTSLSTSLLVIKSLFLVVWICIYFMVCAFHALLNCCLTPDYFDFLLIHFKLIFAFYERWKLRLHF